MDMVLVALVVVLGAAAARIVGGILRFHASMSQHHLRGRYTWTEELAALERVD